MPEPLTPYQSEVLVLLATPVGDEQENGIAVDRGRPGRQAGAAFERCPPGVEIPDVRLSTVETLLKQKLIERYRRESRQGQTWEYYRLTAKGWTAAEGLGAKPAEDSTGE